MIGIVKRFLNQGKTGKKFINGMAFKGSGVQVPSAPPYFERK